MHTGKYEKLRFRNICRVCEAAGWAAECPGPRSSPTTAEWRVMRILYPSVSRHSPSSPPTFFILSSHHTNSYGHKMEREGVREVKWEREQYTGCPSSLPSLTFAVCPPPMIDNHTDIILPVPHAPLYCPSHPKPTHPPPLPTPTTDTRTHTLFILWPWALTLLKTFYWVNLPGQTIHHIGELVGRWGHSVIASVDVLSYWNSCLWRLSEDSKETTMLILHLCVILRRHQWS